MLFSTIEPHELVDPQVEAERLLFRLYHEDGVTVYPSIPLTRHCTCSRPSIEDMLKRFSIEERAAMVENGEIGVTCEFCSTHYRFTPAGLA